MYTYSGRRHETTSACHEKVAAFAQPTARAKKLNGRRVDPCLIQNAHHCPDCFSFSRPIQVKHAAVGDCKRQSPLSHLRKSSPGDAPCAHVWAIWKVRREKRVPFGQCVAMFSKNASAPANDATNKPLRGIHGITNSCSSRPPPLLFQTPICGGVSRLRFGGI